MKNRNPLFFVLRIGDCFFSMEFLFSLLFNLLLY